MSTYATRAALTKARTRSAMQVLDAPLDITASVAKAAPDEVSRPHVVAHMTVILLSPRFEFC